MNERIEELVETVISQNESEWPDYREVMTGAGSLYLHVFAETFAELMAREAIAVVQKRFMGDLNREDIEVRRCVEDLKKHFGVE